MTQVVQDILLNLKVEAEGGGSQAKQTAEDIRSAGGAYKDAKKEANAAGDSFQDAGTKAERSGKQAQKGAVQVKGLGNSFKEAAKNVLAFAGVDAGVRAVFRTIESGVGSIVSFEKELAQLSAITGATGGDLAFLRDQAREVGRTTTLSAEDAVRAFTAIGSARPELLLSKDALVAVTKESIALAEASGIDLAEAGQATAGALNQFNLPASEAARVVNVLAAGSLKGAANVGDLSESIAKAGTVLGSANVTFEESVALLETLADKELKGAEAGTQIRGVLLKLQKEGKGFVDGQFDISAALEQTKNDLEAIQDPSQRVAELTKLVGEENATAATILIDNADRFQELKAAITGTNTAYDQQKIVSQTVSAALERVRGQWNDLFLTFTSSASLLGKALNFVGDNLRTFIKIFLTMGAAVLSYVTATKAAVFITSAWRAAVVASRIAMLLFTGQAGAATAAMRVFNVAVKANPIGLLVSLLATAISAFAFFSEEAEQASEAQDLLNEKLREAAEIERQIADIRDRADKNPFSISTAEAERAIGSLSEKLNQLAEDSFDAREALADGKFKVPPLETVPRPDDIPDDAFFFDQDRLNKETEVGQRNIRKVYLAYREYITQEIEKLQKIIAERNRKTDAPGSGAGSGVLSGSIASIQKEVEALRKKLIEGTKIGSEEFAKTATQFKAKSEELKEALKALREDEDVEAFAKGSIGDLRLQVGLLRKEIEGLAETDPRYDNLVDAFRIASAKLKALQERLDAETKDDRKERLSERQAELSEALRHENELGSISEESNQRKLQRELFYAEKTLDILIDSGVATEAELTAAYNKILELRAKMQADSGEGGLFAFLATEAGQAATDLAQATLDGFSQIAQANRTLSDTLIAEQEQRVSRAVEISEKGNAALLDAEKKRLAELKEARRKSSEDLALISQLEVSANSAVAISKAAAQGGAAAPITVAATLIALIAGLARARAAASQGFYKGGYTGDIDPRSESLALGPKNYTYHGKEFVMDHVVTGIGDNKSIFDWILRDRVDMGRLLESRQTAISFSGGMSSAKADEMIRALQSAPAPYVKVDRDGFTYGIRQTMRRESAMKTRR